ncbi:MAG: cupin domain-containing protein [Solirubrobacteraceae bacterium]
MAAIMPVVVPEAHLKRTESGLEPAGEGWFVLNAREAKWLDGHFGAYTRFEGEARFPSLGVNIGVLAPGQPSCMYHGEEDQEDFLVLAGECLLLIEGEERHLKQWDFVHCPPWTEHVFVGAGDGPCALLGVGTRSGKDVIYPRTDLALRHNAGVEQETREPREAYADIRPDVEVAYRDGWLEGH